MKSANQEDSVIRLDVRLRDVEKSIVSLSTQIQQLAEISEKSQAQVADQSKIQSEILFNIKKNIDQIDAIKKEQKEISNWKLSIGSSLQTIKGVIRPVILLGISIITIIITEYLKK